MSGKISFLLSVNILFSIACFSQKSTIYFYRLKSLAFSNTIPTITINGTESFSIPNGSYKKIETEADSISITTSLNNPGLNSLKMDKETTYYIQVEVLSPGSAELKLQTEFSGKPAIERLDADKLAAESANLESVKVTGIESLPESDSQQAVIYLYRPFNVTGVALIANVSDGKRIYEMKNNSSIVVKSEPGEIIFRTVNEGKNTSNTSLKLNIEKGKVYYVAILRSGGALVLTETKQEYAKKEMKL